jgi:predicted deacylase
MARGLMKGIWVPALMLTTICGAISCAPHGEEDLMPAKMKFERYEIPGQAPRPAWWQVRNEEIIAAAKGAKKGQAFEIATSAAGFPVYAVAYGPPRAKAGTATWASASNSRNPGAYKTNEAGEQVVLLVCGTHAAEVEAVAGATNLISLLETGKDLRGQSRPKLVELAGKYRLVIVPCLNMDGRAITPDHLKGATEDQALRANQGSWKDGRPIGYPGCKEWSPLPMEKVAHPGGYANADGYNIQHDANPAQFQTKEAAGLLKLVSDEQADLVLLMHSHEIGGQILGASMLDYPLHVERAHAYKQRVFDALQARNLRPGPVHKKDQRGGISLNTTCTMASGGLAVTLEQGFTADWTFDEALETFYVAVETFLEGGLKERFSPRLPTARGQSEG